jgi:hypothetical protein
VRRARLCVEACGGIEDCDGDALLGEEEGEEETGGAGADDDDLEISLATGSGDGQLGVAYLLKCLDRHAGGL